jgi:hypothetical protein
VAGSGPAGRELSIAGGEELGPESSTNGTPAADQSSNEYKMENVSIYAFYLAVITNF